MIIKTRPAVVFYTCYEGCTITEALLHAFQNAKGNTLTLPSIGDIKVNGNRLIGSYGKAIQNLRDSGYKIETTTKHHKNHITTSEYTLSNPTFNSDGTNF